MQVQNNPNQESMMGRVAGAGLMPVVLFMILSIAFGFALVLLLPAFNILPPQASEQAQRTDTLFTVLMFLGGIVFFLVEGLIYYAALRFRAKANDVSDGPSIHGNTLLEIVWTVIPSFVVVALAIYSFIVWQANTAVSDTPNLVAGTSIDINAYGQRFAWSFEYVTNETDVNSEPIVLNSSEIHVYVGEDVSIEMETRDVIHAFWVPAMRVKQDLLPGRVTTIRFNPVDPGTGWEFANAYAPVTVYSAQDATSAVVYELAKEGAPVRLELADHKASISVDWVEVLAPNGQRGFVAGSALTGRYNRYRLICAELCGSGHGNMYSWLVLHESEEAMQANWYSAEVEEKRVPSQDPVVRGEQILSSGQYPCANCHVLDSLAWSGTLGPSLNGIGSRAASRAGNTGDSSGADYLAHSVRRPNAYLVAGYSAGLMPYFGNTDAAPEGAGSFQQMTQDELMGVVAYLCTQTESGNPDDTTCNLPNWDVEEGALVDVDAVVEELRAITDDYQE